MLKRPGGVMAARPLHFFWICDCSGSMSVDGKIEALNNAIREALPHMRRVADENPNADVFVRVLKFSHGAEWHTLEAEHIKDFEWNDLKADALQPPLLNTDIIFLLDTSGSMSDEIEAVKKSCTEFADLIIKEGGNVRLGLIGFDIGGHRGKGGAYKVYNLSRYTIGIWSLTSPQEFKQNIASLSLALFGGQGCYLANQDTVDIFPHIVRAFDGPSANLRILVIISDEMGDTKGLSDIVSQLDQASIKTHVLGVPGRDKAHESLARMAKGQFWDITSSKGVQDFSSLLEQVAQTVAQEVVKTLANGGVSKGTDMGVAMQLIAEQLKIPPMTDRGLPPVLVLISDGQANDDFADGLRALMAEPWGKRAVRIAISIGKDADQEALRQFIGHSELSPLPANNPNALVNNIKWASTAVLKSASSPASQSEGFTKSKLNAPIPAPPEPEQFEIDDVW